MSLADIALWKTVATAGVFLALFSGERLAPAARRPHFERRLARNAGLWLGMAATSILVGAPLSAAAASVGLWARPDAVPAAAWFVVDMIVLDLWVYFAHRAYHAAPLMWRLHGVHHLDEHLDTTSAARFHALEIALSALIRMPLIAALAIPLAHVLVYDALLFAAAIFHHSNLRLPAAVERAVSRVIVTPSIHWVHHHARRADTDSNYAGILSVWDGLFGTRSPTKRTAAMKIGVEGLCDRPLVRLWLAPFGAPMR
jgi:sterol desaturase/sphingolipid hydroxylase (fatty acid hydroxylase superfamily)